MKTLRYIVQMIFGIGLIIYSGWILTYLWAWFIMPITELGPLTIAYACGLSLVISYVKFNPVKEVRELNHIGENHKHERWQALVIGFTIDSLMFFMGWIVTLFI